MFADLLQVVCRLFVTKKINKRTDFLRHADGPGFPIFLLSKFVEVLGQSEPQNEPYNDLGPKPP